MSFADKLKKIEEEKQHLVEKRLLEIAKLADRSGVLSLDNNLLVGAFLYALEASQSKNEKILEDLISRAKKMPSRTKSAFRKDKKSDKKTDKPSIQG